MKGFNLRTKEFRENLAKCINESQLPVGISTMVISEVLHELKAAELKMIELEAKAYEKELSEKEGAEDGR
jgi:hypothetical protein